MRIIGWDVGGAHLKAALVETGRVTRVMQVPCPLWLDLGNLHAALRELMGRLGAADLHAATMTGELADIFPDRAAGVASITAMLVEATRPLPLVIYSTKGFVPPGEAARHTETIASANWHATAALAARFVPDALVVDIGSTTTDLVPVADGAPCPIGLTDAQRMACGELVYTGLVRTPLMALGPRAPFAGCWTTLACEVFATTADAYRLLGELPAGADLLPSADGREKTEPASRARLARMIGCDAGDGSQAALQALAGWFVEVQLRHIVDAALLVLSRGQVRGGAPILAAGVGRHVARRLAARLGRDCVDFDPLPVGGDPGPPALGQCAPAVAVALLAGSRGY